MESSSIISVQNLSEEQIAEASRYLAETRDALLESAATLSPEQWVFKPSIHCWSIAEIVEHVVIIDRRIHIIVENMSSAPEPPAEWEQAEMDSFIPRMVPNRSTKVQAPPPLQPTQGWRREEALENFSSTRRRTIELLSAPSLRGHVYPHPIFGPWDGYQWLMAAGAHNARHAEQAREVQACSNFPQTGG